MLRKAKRGQVTVEVAVLFGVVIAALVAISVYLQRGAQGGVKSSADSLGSQFSTTGAWDSDITVNSTTNENQTTVTTTQNQTLNYTQTLQ
jgi:uncharacterized protein (UPF0333 family)